ncbi:hypothetical protein BJX65DRAFT_273753 [Aspergillus insuetus]
MHDAPESKIPGFWACLSPAAAPAQGCIEFSTIKEELGFVGNKTESVVEIVGGRKLVETCKWKGADAGESFSNSELGLEPHGGERSHNRQSTPKELRIWCRWYLQYFLLIKISQL